MLHALAGLGLGLLVGFALIDPTRRLSTLDLWRFVPDSLEEKMNKEVEDLKTAASTPIRSAAPRAGQAPE